MRRRSAELSDPIPGCINLNGGQQRASARSPESAAAHKLIKASGLQMDGGSGGSGGGGGGGVGADISTIIPSLIVFELRTHTIVQKDNPISVRGRARSDAMH